jgi:hypothetical protein
MPKATVQEFATAVRKAHPGAYDDVPDDHQLTEAILKAHPEYGNDVDLRTFSPSKTMRAAQAAPAKDPSEWSAFPAEDVVKGAYKGAAETGTNIMKFVKGAATGDFGPFDDPSVEPEINKGLESRNVLESIGKTVEHTGEYMAGEAGAKALVSGVTAIPKIAKLVAAAPKAAKVIGRIAQGAAVGGTIAAAQGGSGTVGAVIGGAGPAVGEVAEAVAPKVAKLSARLAESAQKSYARTMGATKETMKNMASKVIGGYEAPIAAGEQTAKDVIAAKAAGEALPAAAESHVPGLIERKISAWTRKGLSEHSANEVENLGEQIDNLWSEMPEGTKVKADGIKQAIEDAKGKFQELGPEKTSIETKSLSDIGPDEKYTNIDLKSGTADVERKTQAMAVAEPAAVKNLTRVSKLIDTLTDDAGEVDVHQLRKVKGIFDKVVADKGGYAGKQLSIADSAGVLARKEAANSIRNELAKQFPDIAVVNREFHFWSQVQDVMDETLRRTSSQSQPMGQQLAKVAGAAAMGHAGAAKAMMTGQTMGLLRKVTTSAGWNTKIAAPVKTALADAIASGNGAGTMKMLRNIAFGLGIAATNDATAGGDSE